MIELLLKVRPEAGRSRFPTLVSNKFAGFLSILCSFLNVQSGSKVALQTIALENTSIKVGPARKTKNKGKMARRSKKSKRRDNYDRWVGVLKLLNSFKAKEINILTRTVNEL